MASSVHTAKHHPAPTIVHVDMDSFYVSVERLANPTLIGKPVAVGGTPEGRGVVSSASYEARIYGVRSAMPMAEALRKCPNLTIVSSSFGLYSEYSAKIKSVMESFTPLVEMASQDEAYLDLSGTERLFGPPLVLAQSLREEIFRLTQLPCSIGLGANRTVAKIASALCKPRALLYIPHGSEKTFLARLDAKRLPGIGPATLKGMHSLGITTLGQLQKADQNVLTRHFGTHGLEMQERASGIASSQVFPSREAKSISAETTFEEDSNEVDGLSQVLSILSEKVAWRLRESGKKGRTVVLKYRYKGLETHTASRTLSSATSDDLRILSEVKELFHEKWNGNPIRLLGVGIAGLVESNAQLDLLDSEVEDQREELSRAVDHIREKHGFKYLSRASSFQNTPKKDPRT